jgi:hypothetical protein
MEHYPGLLIHPSTVGINGKHSVGSGKRSATPSSGALYLDALMSDGTCGVGPQ